MDPARQLAQLADRLLGLTGGGVQLHPDVLGDRERVGGAASSLERQHDADEPLLGAIVEVPLEAPALVLGGGDDPLSRLRDRLELLPSLGLEALVLEGKTEHPHDRTDELRGARASPGRGRSPPTGGRPPRQT